MWLAEKFLNLNQKKWLGFLEYAGMTADEEHIFRIFYIADNIDFMKFQENLNANEISKAHGGLEFWEMLKKVSADPIERMQKVNCTPTFKEHFTKNDYIPRGIPEWFYIGYPDVAVWIMDNSKLIEEEFEGREDEIITEDGPNLNFYRKMIDRYKKKVGKLECSV